MAATTTDAPTETLQTPGYQLGTGAILGMVGMVVALMFGSAIWLPMHFWPSANSASAPAPDPQAMARLRYLAHAEDDVKNQLNDPASAQFKDIIVSVSGKCAIGQVIAKNGFGAFGGYQQFVWHDGFVYFQGPIFSKSSFDRWNNCMNHITADDRAGTPTRATGAK